MRKSLSGAGRNGQRDNRERKTGHAQSDADGGASGLYITSP